MKATRKLIPAIALLLVSAVLLSTASYAWFTTNKIVTASMNVSVTAPQNLQIKEKTGDAWAYSLSLGTAGTLKPAYTNALMYYDCCSFATLVDKDVNVSLSAGLGDLTCPPSGIMAVYNTLDCNKNITVYQNTTHSYNPPSRVSYRLRNN